MLHRVLATYDICIAVEVHVSIPPDSLSAVGVSVSTLQWLQLYSKKAQTVEMDSARVNPLGLGHDTGILRPHILITIAPPLPMTSVIASLKATALSSCKPMFSAHKTQAGCQGSSLPLTADPFPSAVGLLLATVCGGPVNLPAPVPVPLIPTQLSVWTGMTLGDIIGGIVNVAVDIAVSAILTAIGMLTGDLGDAIISYVLPVSAVQAKVENTSSNPSNMDTGVDNPGQIVQQGVDNDGVGSGATSSARLLGFGAQSTNQGGGPVSGAEGVAPWSQ